jgi:chloride channel 3/4/5
VLLVTKAVGDFLGTNGIADEMIRFNGYPFLEKEDHAYNVSGKCHKTSISSLPSSFLSVRCYATASTYIDGHGDVHEEPR